MTVKSKMSSKEKLAQLIPSDEEILWMGAPVRKPYYLTRIVESVSVPLMWMLISFYILSVYIGFGVSIIPIPTLVIGMVIVNIPMIMWLCKTVTTGIALKNTYYFVTNKAVYFKNGANEFEVFKTEEERYEYADIIDMWNHAGFIDNIYGVGDVYFKLKRKGKVAKFYIMDVKDPVALLSVIKKAKGAW